MFNATRPSVNGGQFGARKRKACRILLLVNALEIVVMRVLRVRDATVPEAVSLDGYSFSEQQRRFLLLRRSTALTAPFWKRKIRES
jgi:hypothetical protein